MRSKLPARPELMTQIEDVASQLEAILSDCQLSSFLRSRLPLLTADAQLWWVWAPRIESLALSAR